MAFYGHSLGVDSHFLLLFLCFISSFGIGTLLLVGFVLLGDFSLLVWSNKDMGPITGLQVQTLANGEGY